MINRDRLLVDWAGGLDDVNRSLEMTSAAIRRGIEAMIQYAEDGMSFDEGAGYCAADDGCTRPDGHGGDHQHAQPRNFVIVGDTQ